MARSVRMLSTIVLSCARCTKELEEYIDIAIIAYFTISMSALAYYGVRVATFPLRSVGVCGVAVLCVLTLATALVSNFRLMKWFFDDGPP